MQKSREEGVKFVEETLPTVLTTVPNATAAKVIATGDLEAAIENAWMVFEVVPEHLHLKKELFGTLDAKSSADTILASNSSSFPASQFTDNVKRPERVLNTHFYMPPDIGSWNSCRAGKPTQGLLIF